jgi:O-antigen ligase
MAKQPPVTMEELYALKPKAIWRQFWSEHWSFWMICGYLFVEYVRPQSIIPAIDFLPWASLFLMLSLIGAVLDPSVKWVKAPANKWMILYLVVVFLSIIGADYKDWSYKYLDQIYTWVIIYFLIINIVNTPKRLFIFLGVFVIASFKISLSLAMVWAQRGFAFTTWGLQGPPGFFMNSGELAIQMSVFFPIAYVIALKLRPYLPKWGFYILALMPVTAAMVILGASSRGGQLALAVQMLLMFHKQIFRLKTLVPVAIAFAVAFHFLPEEQKQRFSETGTDKTSLQRLYYWEGGWEMLNTHTLLGVGYFNFPPNFQAMYPDRVLYASAQLPHNILVQVGSELGYVGLLVYTMLLINSFFSGRNPEGGVVESDLMARLPWAFNISIVGFFVAGQFVSVVYYPFLWVHLAIMMVLRNIWPKIAVVQKADFRRRTDFGGARV